jgi:3-hydroxyisobutyryl-CoA hydrolase
MKISFLPSFISFPFKYRTNPWSSHNEIREKTDTMRFTTKLLPSRSKNLGVLLLNNPALLHALTGDMIDCMEDVIHEWRNDSSMRAILIKSSEAKRPAFCAGGDVKSVYENGLRAGNPEEFFFNEYRVNHAVATSRIPIISFWDGVVMGGGAGISVHGKYRIATENTLFAMPECGIGLFPDVGSMWWMTRLLTQPVAKFLALTGKRIDSADLMYTGIATHYVPSNRLEDLEYALAEATLSVTNNDDNASTKDDVVAGVLMSFHQTIPTDSCYLSMHKDSINRTFDKESVEDIVANLKAADTTDFNQMTLESMSKLSPTCMILTLEGLKRGAMCTTIGEDLQMEYRMAKACVRSGSDFYEGIRALLVDKDHSPKWNPTSIDNVSGGMIEEFFAPIEKEWPIPTIPSRL